MIILHPPHSTWTHKRTCSLARTDRAQKHTIIATQSDAHAYRDLHRPSKGGGCGWAPSGVHWAALGAAHPSSSLVIHRDHTRGRAPDFAVPTYKARPCAAGGAGSACTLPRTVAGEGLRGQESSRSAKIDLNFTSSWKTRGSADERVTITHVLRDAGRPGPSGSRPQPQAAGGGSRRATCARETGRTFVNPGPGSVAF